MKNLREASFAGKIFSTVNVLHSQSKISIKFPFNERDH